MKRLLLIVVLALIGFYVAWPAVSAWQIRGAVEGKDPVALSQKIDFQGVRASMRPAVEDKIRQRIDEMKERGGSTAAIVGSLVQGGLLTNITEVVLKSIVTPENMIRLAHQKGSLPEKIDRIIREQFGELGAQQQPATREGGETTSKVGSVLNTIKNIAGGVVKTLERDGQPVKTVDNNADRGGDAKPPKIGFSNIKSFGFAGPLAFDIGFARDPNAPEPELTARMEFKEFDWKLSQVVPNFR